ncbi:hypothetical protein PAXRUDRAFT_21298 [Paxillus rubicundulus Ve08.2h10]|uniref:Uncharacterized protein n=1 Tax=Paxillus rubicundulus Ve08.2h10 TaxID=930991 RepID=A0A0D0CC36_9AGAM|nr:hypothetical protein PAXRUDRAFT_21298 [Paxillus rubicundulus Ve08.2h10]
MCKHEWECTVHSHSCLHASTVLSHQPPNLQYEYGVLTPTGLPVQFLRLLLSLVLSGLIVALVLFGATNEGGKDVKL